MDLNYIASYGEKIIYTILRENNIIFKTEKSIYTGRKRPQRLDFYLELQGKKYAIEYMGSQHFKQATGAWDKPLKEIQELDKIKYEYCQRNDINILYINHPNVDKKDIFEKIKYFLDIDMAYTEVIYELENSDENEKIIIDFYKNNNVEDTAKEFSITTNQVKGILNKTGFTKRFDKVVGLNVKTGEEKEFDSIADAENYIGKKGVNRSILGKSKLCGGHMWKYKSKDYSEKSKTITDKRIKVYEISKDGFKDALPLQMLSTKYNLEKSSTVEVAKGNRNHVSGFSVKEVTGEEKDKILSQISYVDYIKSTHLIND